MRHSEFIRDGKLERDAAAAEIRRFLDLLLASTRLALHYDVSLADGAAGNSAQPQIIVNFHGEDESLLLEDQAELLLAIEHIATRWLRLAPEYHAHLRFDCTNFRALRLEELQLAARVAAQRVRETHQAFHFNPMPARERRLIHLELNNAQGVRTESEGVGERRHLVIYPVDSRR